MSDLISRQAAINALTEYGNGRAVFISVGEAVIRIENLPSAEPKRGKWIDKGWTGDWQYLTDGRGDCWRNIVCSECGESVRHESNFCPNCGAKMEATTPPECEGDCGWCKPSVIEKCKVVTE